MGKPGYGRDVRTWADKLCDAAPPAPRWRSSDPPATIVGRNHLVDRLLTMDAFTAEQAAQKLGVLASSVRAILRANRALFVQVVPRKWDKAAVWRGRNQVNDDGRKT